MGWAAVIVKPALMVASRIERQPSGREWWYVKTRRPRSLSTRCASVHTSVRRRVNNPTSSLWTSPSDQVESILAQPARIWLCQIWKKSASCGSGRCRGRISDHGISGDRRCQSPRVPTGEVPFFRLRIRRRWLLHRRFFRTSRIPFVRFFFFFFPKT